MSTVDYNGITLQLNQTNRYACTPIYSADGLDYLYTSHYYDFNCTLNPMATSYSGSPPEAVEGSLPADTIAAIRHTLLQPRGVLRIDHGGESPLIFSPQSAAGGDSQYPCDVAGGPFPRGCYVVKFGGSKTWSVNFRIETFLLECINGGNPTAFLSNRYQQSTSIDDSFMETLTTEGVAVFRMDVLEFAVASADIFRNVILPPIPNGFKREMIRVALQPQKNQISYACLDRERYFDLGDTNPANGGNGVLDVQATYQCAGVRTPGMGTLSSMTYETVDVHVKGYKTASMWGLTQFAFALARTKLPIGDQKSGFITQSAVSQSLTDKSVSFQISMQLNAPALGPPGVLNAAALRTDAIFPNRGGVNPAPPNDNGTRGYYTAELAVAALTTACGGAKQATGAGSDSKGSSLANQDSNAPPDVQVVVSDDVFPQQPYNFSPAQQSSAFTDYHIDTTFTTDRGIVQCPIASGGSNTATSSSDSTSRPTSEFLTLALPSSRMIVEGTGERINVMPVAPKSDPPNSNMVLLDRNVQTAAGELLGDAQTFVYRISFRYVYGLKKPLDDTQSLALGISPMYNPPDVTGLQSTDFVDDILPDQQGDDDGGDDGDPVGPDGPIGPSV